MRVDPSLIPLEHLAGDCLAAVTDQIEREIGAGASNVWASPLAGYVVEVSVGWRVRWDLTSTPHMMWGYNAAGVCQWSWSGALGPVLVRKRLREFLREHGYQQPLLF